MSRFLRGIVLAMGFAGQAKKQSANSLESWDDVLEKLPGGPKRGISPPGPGPDNQGRAAQ